MDTVGIELYQRVKFGDGFSNELQKLTNPTQFEYVYAGDLLTGGGVYNTFHEVATSPVPRPSWLRVSSRHFHKDRKTKYTDLTREEKEVINQFEGAASYNKVMSNQSYYLVQTEELLKLTS
jgi:hypothetical protein